MQIYFFIVLILLIIGFAFYFVYIKPRQDPYNKAITLSKQNKLLEAVTEFKRILYSNPDSVEIHFKIADIYIRLENYEQAVYHLNEIISILWKLTDSLL